MIALKILQQKQFMAKLLTAELFDRYLLEEASIDTFNTFNIDGKIHREFYSGTDADPEEIPAEDFSRWSKVRPLCLDLIKGKRTPLSFKFVLHLSPEEKAAVFGGEDMDVTPEQISPGLIIKYKSGEVIITTGISYSIFTLDKSAEKAWDNYIPSFLSSNNIDFELL